jgi:hypothetical protein
MNTTPDKYILPTYLLLLLICIAFHLLNFKIVCGNCFDHVHFVHYL